MIIPPVLVHGEGLGAAVAGASLNRLGIKVSCQNPVQTVHGPLLTLNEKTVWIIRDLFGQTVIDQLVAAGVIVHKRFISWSDSSLDRVVEHSLIVSPQVLASALPKLSYSGNLSQGLEIMARGRKANVGIPCGKIHAFLWNKVCKTKRSIDWCATIAVNQTWVNIAPALGADMTVQVVSPQPHPELAAEAAILALSLLGLKGATISNSQPETLLVSPALGFQWRSNQIAMGDELLSLDPISGDGIGHTIRAAVWLTGVMQDIKLSDDMKRWCFNNRMREAFRSHLTNCVRYYSSIRENRAWNDHVSALRLALQQ